MIDGRKDDKHNGVGSLEISKLLVRLDEMFSGMVAFDGGSNEISPRGRCIGSLIYSMAEADWPTNGCPEGGQPINKGEILLMTH